MFIFDVLPYIIVMYCVVLCFTFLQTVVGAMVDAGLPCFQHRPSVLEALRGRFLPHLSDSQACAAMELLIADARNKWTTVMYDVSSPPRSYSLAHSHLACFISLCVQYLSTRWLSSMHILSSSFIHSLLLFVT